MLLLLAPWCQNALRHMRGEGEEQENTQKTTKTLQVPTWWPQRRGWGADIHSMHNRQQMKEKLWFETVTLSKSHCPPLLTVKNKFTLLLSKPSVCYFCFFVCYAELKARQQCFLASWCYSYTTWKSRLASGFIGVTRVAMDSTAAHNACGTPQHKSTKKWHSSPLQRHPSQDQGPFKARTS